MVAPKAKAKTTEISERPFLRAAIEGELERIVHNISAAKEFTVAARYSVLGGGKRLRPILALMVCADLGGEWHRIVPAAAALELLHAASLVHDDLPALDNDDMRRGKPSCHKAFNEATAVLIGDMLVPVALQAVIRADVSTEERLMLVDCLTRAYRRLCSGQYRDLTGARDRRSLEALYAEKTGALFGAAFAVGAIGAHRRPDEVTSFERCGVDLGVLFQMADDFLDHHGTNAERGRGGSSDTRNIRPSFFDGTESFEQDRLMFEKREKRVLRELKKLVPDKISEPTPEMSAQPSTKDLVASLFAGVRERFLSSAIPVSETVSVSEG